MQKKWIRRFKSGGRIRGNGGGKKIFQKPACGRQGMGYVLLALENGRSVFPVERRASADPLNYRVSDPPILFFRDLRASFCLIAPGVAA
jgi:hypothetical protein